MNDASRFERGERYSVVRDITTFRGVDPVTGLDVLIYDFPGAPTAAAGSLTSEYLLPLLAAEQSGGRGTVVSALPNKSSLVAAGERVIDDRFVLQAVTGLRDAHELGLVHGDISTSRILHDGSQVHLEGYGVPWAGADAPTGERALHADLHSLVRALLELSGDTLSAEVSAALKGASAKGSYPPMNAPRLHAIVRRLAGGAVKVPAAGFNDLTLPTTGNAASAQRAPEPPARTEAAPQRPPGPSSASSASSEPHAGGASSTDRRPPTTPAAVGEAFPEDPEPITLNSDPGLTPPGEAPGSDKSPRDTSPGFVKALPPGATYRHGNLEDGLRPAPIQLDRQEIAAARRRSWRGPALLLLIVLVAGLAAYLAILAQERDNSGTSAAAVYYLVDVRVEPANMPPVQLVVEQSPPGSTYAQGTGMASVPRSVPFDAVGTWVVHGRFQERTTPSVTLQVPEDTSITLTFPADDTEE